MAQYPYYTAPYGSVGHAGGGLLSTAIGGLIGGHYAKQLSSQNAQQESAMQLQLHQQELESARFAATAAYCEKNNVPMFGPDGVSLSPAFKKVASSLSSADVVDFANKAQAASSQSKIAQQNDITDAYNSEQGKKAVQTGVDADNTAQAFLNQRTGTVSAQPNETIVRPLTGGMPDEGNQVINGKGVSTTPVAVPNQINPVTGQPMSYNVGSSMSTTPATIQNLPSTASKTLTPEMIKGVTGQTPIDSNNPSGSPDANNPSAAPTAAPQVGSALTSPATMPSLSSLQANPMNPVQLQQIQAAILAQQQQQQKAATDSEGGAGEEMLPYNQ